MPDANTAETCKNSALSQFECTGAGQLLISRKVVRINYINHRDNTKLDVLNNNYHYSYKQLTQPSINYIS